jgi:hypothetical protein
MQRRNSKARHTSTHRSQTGAEFDAFRSLKALQKRIARLEQEVAQLKGARKVEDEQVPLEKRNRPGRKPVHLGMLLHERDQLIQMLEQFWPELEPFCSQNPNINAIKRVLAQISRLLQGRHGPPARQLLKHLPQVVQFLSTNRFRGDPRQIANAFAGAPSIGTWRSLKVCQASPCQIPIGERAIRAYIRRKHKRLYAELSADISIVNFATELKRYRSRDPKLQAYSAQHLHIAWNDSAPDYRRFGIQAAVHPALPNHRLDLSRIT